MSQPSPLSGTTGFSRWDVLKRALADLYKPEVILLLLFDSLFFLIYTWSMIALVDAGWGTNELMFANAARNIIAAGLVWRFAQLWGGHVGTMKWMTVLICIVALAGTGVLLFTAFDQVAYYWWVFGAIVSAYSALFTLRVLGHVVYLPRIQEGVDKNIKLAIILVVIPVVISLLSIGSGIFAEESILYPLWGGFVALLILLTYLLISKSIYTVISNGKTNSAKKATNRIKAMISVSVMANMLNMVIKWVITPLYFYTQMGGSPKKLGVALGAFSLIVILTRLVEDHIKGREFPSYKVMVYGALTVAASYLIWGIFEGLLIAFAMVAVREIGATVFTYGYFVELKRDQSASYEHNMRRHCVFNYAAVGVSFLVLALVAEDIMAHMQSLLLLAGVCYIIGVLAFMRFFPPPQSEDI